VIELLLGLLAAALFGAPRGWPYSAIVAAGVAVGAVLYMLSCAVWESGPCWWPWCTKGKSTRSGPGRAYHRKRPCRVCGGKDRLRLGARMWRR
jgi:hypothetical protein